MLVMVVFFIAFRWIHLSTPLIRLFLLVLILLLMPTLNFLPVWFALSLLRFRSEERRVGKECRSRWSRYVSEERRRSLLDDACLEQWSYRESHDADTLIVHSIVT